MKAILTLAILMSSASAFAMGHTDNQRIQPTLDALEAEGFECKNVWPKDVYQSQIAPGGEFEVGLDCVKKDGTKKQGKIVYQVDLNQYARCRDMSALSIEMK